MFSPSEFARLRARASRGFTLIEVLVVVAIIALLIAILLPSLRAARDAAKLSVCKTREKQIGTMIASYQAEFQNYVPKVISRATHSVDAKPPPPDWQYTNSAKDCLLSVAFRSYVPSLKSLFSSKNPSDPLSLEKKGTWSGKSLYWFQNDYWNLYEYKHLPEQYVCPFASSGPMKGETLVRTSTSLGEIGHLYREGRYETYQTWRHANTPSGLGGRGRGQPTWVGAGSPPLYYLKYDTMPLNRKLNERKLQLYGKPPEGSSKSPSEWMISWCSRGSWVPAWDVNDRPNAPDGQPMPANNIYHPGSHRISDVGGTNVLFADTHVEWVRYSQVGFE